MANRHYIPKVKTPVYLEMRDGMAMNGNLFVQADQRLSDLLNAPEIFTPFMREDGYVVLLNKLEILRVLPLGQRL